MSMVVYWVSFALIVSSCGFSWLRLVRISIAFLSRAIWISA